MTKPWQRRAFELALAHRYDKTEPEPALSAIARAIEKPAREVQRFLNRTETQADLVAFHQAVVEALKARALDPLQAIMDGQQQAAERLVQVMEAAAVAGDLEQTRLAAVAILAHGGNAPIKRERVDHLHLIATMNDPDVLRRIIQTGEVPPGLPGR